MTGPGGALFVYRLLRRYVFFFFAWWGLGRQRWLDLSMWELISTLWPCPSAGSRGASNQGSRRSRPQSRTSGWIPQSHSAWHQWWATGRCGECWSPSPSLNNPASAADTKGQTPLMWRNLRERPQVHHLEDRVINRPVSALLSVHLSIY